jgi:phage shock protein C
MDDRLYRSRSDRMIAGVAGGLADRYDLDPSLVRIAWALVILGTGGLLFLLYIVMAIVVPEEPLDGATAAAGWSAPPAGGATAAAATPAPSSAEAPASGAPGEPSTGTVPEAASAATPAVSAREARRAARREAGGSNAPLVFGAILVIIGLVAFIGQVFPQIDFDLIWPIGLILLGGALVVGARRRGSPS